MTDWTFDVEGLSVADLKELSDRAQEPRLGLYLQHCTMPHSVDATGQSKWIRAGFATIFS